MVRLLHALAEVEPGSREALFGLAVEEIRRERFDLARHYRSPSWQALHDPCPAPGLGWAADRGKGPRELEDLLALHDALGKLSADECELLRLVIDEGKSQDEVARLLHVSLRTAQRRWEALLRKLCALLNAR